MAFLTRDPSSASRRQRLVGGVLTVLLVTGIGPVIVAALLFQLLGFGPGR